MPQTVRARSALPVLVWSLFAWPLAASAQSPVPPPPEAKPAQPSPEALSANMAARLRKAGFTDLQILPNSVFVRGRDKAGHAVAMVLDPKTMTELVTLDPHGGTGAPTPTGSSTFTTVPANETLASLLFGTDILDKKGIVLGKIRDIAIDHDGVRAYVVRVGGMLGIGERFVAVTPQAVTLTFDKAAGRYTATMEATQEQMKAAPEFRYAAVDRATK